MSRLCGEEHEGLRNLRRGQDWYKVTNSSWGRIGTQTTCFHSYARRIIRSLSGISTSSMAKGHEGHKGHEGMT